MYAWTVAGAHWMKIMTVHTTDANPDEARREARRQLSKPGREQVLALWERLGCPIFLTTADDAIFLKGHTTTEGRAELMEKEHEIGPAQMVMRICENGCPACGCDLVSKPGAWDWDEPEPVEQFCPNPDCGVLQLDIYPTPGGDWVAGY